MPDILSASESIVYRRSSFISFSVTALENESTKANRFEMTRNYNTKLHECGDTGLIKRQKMFLCHIEDMCISKVLLSKLMSSSMT